MSCDDEWTYDVDRQPDRQACIVLTTQAKKEKKTVWKEK